MNMYVLVDPFQEGWYWDFAADAFEMKLSTTCLLPTREFAKEIIKTQFHSDPDFAVMEITIISLNGGIQYSYQSIWEEVEA